MRLETHAEGLVNKVPYIEDKYILRPNRSKLRTSTTWADFIRGNSEINVQKHNLLSLYNRFSASPRPNNRIYQFSFFIL